MSSSSSPGTALAAWAAGLLRVRWVVRVPVGLYRARLGFLFGSRLLMLEHTGRKSGARRHVVLEVVGHPRPGTYVVVSGFGDRAQWFRNVRADPRVRVFAGSRRPAPATARLLSTGEAAAALTAYAARHPRAWASLKPVLEATLGAQVDTTGTSLPVIALDLIVKATSPPSPPPAGFRRLTGIVVGRRGRVIQARDQVSREDWSARYRHCLVHPERHEHP